MRRALYAVLEGPAETRTARVVQGGIQTRWAIVLSLRDLDALDRGSPRPCPCVRGHSRILQSVDGAHATEHAGQLGGRSSKHGDVL